MDEQRFDAIARAVDQSDSRRGLVGRAVKGILAGVLGVGVGAAVVTDAPAQSAQSEESLRRCRRRCRRQFPSPIRRRICRRECERDDDDRDEAGTPIGRGGFPLSSVCRRDRDCDSGSCANISPGSGLGRCARCPGQRVCGSGRNRQCCFARASCDDDVCRLD